MSHDPPRLRDDPGTSAALRRALDAAREDVPSDAQLDALAAKLGPLLGGPGGGGAPPGDGGAALSGASAFGGKALGGLAIAAAGVAVAALVLTPDDPAPPPRRPDPVIEAPAPRVESEPVPEGVDVPTDLEPEAPTPRPPPRRPTFEVDPAAELALLRRMQDDLRTDPAAALETAREHERRFGPGTLAQEREVVAIDALDRLGRDAEARARAEAFRTRWPRSAHLRRIDVILE